MARYLTPFDHWNNAVQVGMITLEAQAVIAMRLWGMGGLWAVAPGEQNRMVSEKVHALTQASTKAGLAMMSGKRPDQVVAAAVRPVRRKTRSNAKRLAKRGPKLR